MGGARFWWERPGLGWEGPGLQWEGPGLWWAGPGFRAPRPSALCSLLIGLPAGVCPSGASEEGPGEGPVPSKGVEWWWHFRQHTCRHDWPRVTVF